MFSQIPPLRQAFSKHSFISVMKTIYSIKVYLTARTHQIGWTITDVGAEGVLTDPAIEASVLQTLIYICNENHLQY